MAILMGSGKNKDDPVDLGIPSFSYTLLVISPRPIQNLAFSWGGLPGKVAPTCV